MSTTQGPYTVKRHPLDERCWAVYHGNIRVTLFENSKFEADAACARLNAAYAEGQRSKQAELDKAVGLLREMERFIEGDSHIDPDCARRARAYLSTLNPQPDAAQ